VPDPASGLSRLPALALQSSDSYLANRLWARIDRAVVDEAPVAPLYTVKQVDIA
jgi:hypothetical protein